MKSSLWSQQRHQRRYAAARAALVTALDLAPPCWRWSSPELLGNARRHTPDQILARFDKLAKTDVRAAAVAATEMAIEIQRHVADHHREMAFFELEEIATVIDDESPHFGKSGLILGDDRDGLVPITMRTGEVIWVPDEAIEMSMRL